MPPVACHSRQFLVLRSVAWPPGPVGVKPAAKTINVVAQRPDLCSFAFPKRLLLLLLTSDQSRVLGDVARAPGPVGVKPATQPENVVTERSDFGSLAHLSFALPPLPLLALTTRRLFPLKPFALCLPDPLSLLTLTRLFSFSAEPLVSEITFALLILGPSE